VSILPLYIKEKREVMKIKRKDHGAAGKLSFDKSLIKRWQFCVKKVKL